MVTVKNFTLAGLCFALIPVLPAAERTLNDKFYDAIRNGDLKTVRGLLKSGADVDTKDSRGATPLMYAAAVGSVETMRALIAAGADVNSRNSFDATALMWCTGNIDKVRLLLEKGAEPNARSKAGNTPLHIASAQAGNVGTVRLLLEHGASPAKAQNNMGSTALLRAAATGDTAMVKLLFDKGDDPRARDKGGDTALLEAAGRGNVEMVKLLLAKGLDVNAQSEPMSERPVKNGPIALGSFSPLMLAATSRSPEMVRVLLDAGADVNAQDVRGMTPLMLAVATDHPDEAIIRMLLAKHPDISLKSKAGETALAWAAKFQHPAVLPAVKTASVGIEMPRLTPVAVERAGSKDVRNAAEKGLALIQRNTVTFFKEGGCVSCHAQNITTMATAIARQKGIRFDEAQASEVVRATRLDFAPHADGMLERLDPPAAIIQAVALLALAFDGAPADRVTDALVHNLAAQQLGDGSWTGSTINRPPTMDADFSMTAATIRGLRQYAPPARKGEMDARIAKAAAWLINAKPSTTEDGVMQLLGAKWSGADAATLEKFAARLLEIQREDGGWAQTPYLKSDAYATGTVLYALCEAGRLTPSDRAFQRGVHFLLDTQAADGSWYVASRAPKFQPYFESGFPYGHDQWISQWATGWASIALSLAVPEARAAR